MSIVPFLVIFVFAGVIGIASYWFGWLNGYLTAKQEEHGKRKCAS